MIRENLVRDKAQILYTEATALAKNQGSDLYNVIVSLDDVKTLIDIVAVYLESDIRIINPSGRVVIDSGIPLDIETIRIVEEFDPTVFRGSYYIVDQFFHSFESEVLTVIATIAPAYIVQGYVVIHYDMALIEAATNQLLVICYVVFAMLFLLSLIVLLFFTQIVYIPLRKITYATEQYASGNMHYEFQVESEDEIGYLAMCLSYMASEIARSEDDQKKFVANISHDFRSPLTSIQGFLKAMLDGIIPEEDYEKYIHIVLNETERLTKLTNSLLSLNNLNMKGMYLNRSDFDIVQVIRDTTSSFEGTCIKKNITILLTLSGEKLFVNADKEKIQQVLYNLLDNAIKFSHQDSTIQVETSEKKSKVWVSIKDSGIGIPKEDLKLIWDRFYKSDLSRGKDKKGTGLGLSIVREIIRSHNEHINVISTPGEGSEFIFQLTKSKLEEEDEL
jgi:signal transduction histidine kinase